MQQVETAAYAKQLEGFQEGQQRAVGRGERGRDQIGRLCGPGRNLPLIPRQGPGREVCTLQSIV